LNTAKWRQEEIIVVMFNINYLVCKIKQNIKKSLVVKEYFSTCGKINIT